MTLDDLTSDDDKKLYYSSSSYSSCSSAYSHCRPEQRAANTGASISAPTKTPTTTMPEYKLIYFNIRGLGELIRWILHYGNIPFTDERVDRETEWPERKKSIPGGKLPVLEVEGRMLPQSLAIARFLAKKAGLVPENPLAAAFCDSVAETFRDVTVQISRIRKAKDTSEEEKAKNLYEDYIPNTVIPLLQRLEKRFTEADWYVGDKIAWADIAIARSFENLLLDPKLAYLATKFPKMKAHADKVMNLPGIKEWLQKRPVTPL